AIRHHHACFPMRAIPAKFVTDQLRSRIEPELPQTGRPANPKRRVSAARTVCSYPCNAALERSITLAGLQRHDAWRGLRSHGDFGAEISDLPALTGVTQVGYSALAAIRSRTS